jgi:hypothetical protein
MMNSAIISLHECKSKVKYLCFNFVAINHHGEQFCFRLVSFVPEVANQIQFVRAFAAHDFGQLIHLGHLKKTSELVH